MFSDCSPELPFVRTRFDVGTLPPSLEGGRTPRGQTVEDRSRGLQPANLLADRLLNAALLPEYLPGGLLDRLHAWVDELPEDTAA
jgi:hypothetical protein